MSFGQVGTKLIVIYGNLVFDKRSFKVNTQPFSTNENLYAIYETELAFPSISLKSQ